MVINANNMVALSESVLQERRKQRNTDIEQNSVRTSKKIIAIEQKIENAAKNGRRFCEVGSIVGGRGKDEIDYDVIREYFRERGFKWTFPSGQPMMVSW